jgi:hypothetical protein
VRLFCQGLIHPAGAFVGVLFAESADLAGFAGSSDCAECDGTVCDNALIGSYSAQSVFYFGGPDRYGINFGTETGGNIPEMQSLGCSFGFKDNHITVTNFTNFGSAFNVQYQRYGQNSVENYTISDINAFVFDQMYNYFQVYQSTTQFSISFEIDRTIS